MCSLPVYRYDVRGYLHDLSDLNDRQTLKSIDDEKFEMELNRERFRFLCDEENQTGMLLLQINFFFVLMIY